MKTQNDSIQSLLEYIEDEKSLEYLNGIFTSAKLMGLELEFRDSISFIELNISSNKKILSYGPDKILNIQFDINFKKEYLNRIHVQYLYYVKYHENNRD